MSAYDTQVLALGPDAYWKLDEASGLVFADSSGNGNSLTAGAGAVENWRIPGPSTADIPYAVDFANVNPPASSSATLGSYGVGKSFTAEAWIGSVGAVAANTGLVTKGYDLVEQRPWWSLVMAPGGVPIFWFRNAAGTDFKCQGYGNISDASYTSRGPYHHVVGTYSAALADLYVDGVHQAQLAVPNTGWGTGVQPLTLGVLSTTVWGGPWLAAVALYPGQLSATQVTSNFNLGITGSAFTFYQLGQQLLALNTDLSAVLAAVKKTYSNT